MKKNSLTLIVAASAIIHAQAADLESQLPGYWQPDMEKTLALAKQANRVIDPITQALLSKMVLEFQKNTMIVYGPQGMKPDSSPVPVKVKGVDQAGNTLTLDAGGEELKARFDNAQMALNDPKTGWTILNRISQQDFAKLQAGRGDVAEHGGKKAAAAEKLEDISAQPIPDEPATGKVHGREFKVEKATLEKNWLILRQGGGFFADLQFTIFLFGQKGGFDGKKITVKPNQSTTTAHIHLKYMEEGKRIPETEIVMKWFTMRLEFGTAKDGKLPGKIHLRLPDDDRSFVVGTFEAETK